MNRCLRKMKERKGWCNMEQKEQTKKQTMYEKILVEELRNCARLRREWRGNSVYDEK